MTLEEEVKQMVDRILAGDKTINVTDIVKLINERRENNENSFLECQFSKSQNYKHNRLY